MASQQTTDSTGQESASEAPPPRTGWDFAIIVVVLVALVGGTVFIVQHYTTSADASTILGIFVPALTGVGGAIFGVSVGYSTGNSAGAARASAGKAAAVHAAKVQTAAAIAPHVARSREALTKVADSLSTSLPKPAGAKAFRLDAGQSVPQRVDVDAEALADAQQSLEHVDGLLAGLQQ